MCVGLGVMSESRKNDFVLFFDYLLRALLHSSTQEGAVEVKIIFSTGVRAKQEWNREVILNYFSLLVVKN